MFTDGVKLHVPLTGQELNTILAALRFYLDEGMGEPSNRPNWLQALACPTDNNTSLDDQGIDDLYSHIISLTVCDD